MGISFILEGSTGKYISMSQGASALLKSIENSVDRLEEIFSPSVNQKSVSEALLELREGRCSLVETLGHFTQVKNKSGAFRSQFRHGSQLFPVRVRSPASEPSTESNGTLFQQMKNFVAAHPWSSNRTGSPPLNNSPLLLLHLQSMDLNGENVVLVTVFFLQQLKEFVKSVTGESREGAVLPVPSIRRQERLQKDLNLMKDEVQRLKNQKENHFLELRLEKEELQSRMINLAAKLMRVKEENQELCNAIEENSKVHQEAMEEKEEDLKRAKEETLRSKNDMETEMRNIKSTFLSAISHQLRTPMNGK
jgi:hypothetical protein